MLLARILTIVFLVFAFAQPYIPAREEADTTTNQVVGVYIDNSFSMNALSEQGQLLERARNKAAEIGQSYPPGTQFRIFTNDLEPRHQHLFNKEQFIQQVADIKPSPAVIPFSLIHNRFHTQNQNTENDVQGTFYVISDFQRHVTDLENFSGETVFSYFMPLVPNQVNNLYIDSCWVEVPAHGLKQEENIFVKIKNNSDEDYQNLPLKLYLNDSVKSITNFSVSAHDEITTNLTYTNVSSGIQLGKIEITDYPFTFDNTWYISYFVEPKLRALAIYNNNSSSQQGLAYISALFANDDYVELQETDVQSLQVSRLAEYNTIFLINPERFSTGLLNELESVTEEGTSVVLFPETGNNPDFNNQFLSRFGAATVTGEDTTRQEISGIDFDNRFFRDVFSEKEDNALLPEIAGHLKFTGNIRTEESNLLWFQNGDKALSMLPYGDGKVWVFSFPLNKSNEAFARDILFVPSIYNIVLNSIPAHPFSYTIGNDISFTLPPNRDVPPGSGIEIENKNTGDAFIPETRTSGRGIRIEPGSSVEDAGHYLVKANNETLTALAYNFSREESDLRYFSRDELEERIEMHNLQQATVISDATSNFSEILDEIQRGKQLWKWCILLALFFILSEVLIARFWKQ